jgi:tetratricopeptide (TPR) repeat protein
MRPAARIDAVPSAKESTGDMTANDAYVAALTLAPTAGDHMRIPGSQAFVNGMNEAWALLEQAVARDPAFAPAHAARGNILVRGGFLDDACAAYARAAELDPDDAATRYALAELALLARDEAVAETLFAAAFARNRLFSPPVPQRGARHALMLCHAGPWPANMPLDFLLDDRQWTLHRWFLPDPNSDTRAVPAVDLVIDALGESLGGHPALADAERIIARLGIPAINDPRRLRGLGRDRLAVTLANVTGARVASSWRVSRDDLAAGNVAFTYPLLVRPVDTHGGRGLERIEAPSDLARYLAGATAPLYDCSAFVEYRSADGWYRKYRIMFVNGVAYPYHLAIHDDWMVHYHRTETTETAWMNDEEALFLTEPQRAFAGWNSIVSAIGAAIGLDYVGIDCTQLADGTVLVFEADSAMLVHALDRSAAGRVKRAATARIAAALTALFALRAG